MEKNDQTGQRAMPVIAVVIPAYRAASRIEKVIGGIPELVSIIVVVNDCSPDNTAEVVNKIDDRRIHLVSHEVNQGVGAATLTGYDKACALGAEIIVKMDSDDQMDSAWIPMLIEPIRTGKADYVKGNRFLYLGELSRMPLRRRIGNLGLSFLTKLASGCWHIFDPSNGYTAISASIVPMLYHKRIHKRYFFESSMLLEMGLHRAAVRDVAMPARYGDEKSSLSEWNALVTFPPKLLHGLLRRVVIQYFLRDFTAVSVYLLAGGGLHTVWRAMGLLSLASVHPDRGRRFDRNGYDRGTADHFRRAIPA